MPHRNKLKISSIGLPQPITTENEPKSIASFREQAILQIKKQYKASLEKMPPAIRPAWILKVVHSQYKLPQITPEERYNLKRAAERRRHQASRAAKSMKNQNFLQSISEFNNISPRVPKYNISLHPQTHPENTHKLHPLFPVLTHNLQTFCMNSSSWSNNSMYLPSISFFCKACLAS